MCHILNNQCNHILISAFGSLRSHVLSQIITNSILIKITIFSLVNHMFFQKSSIPPNEELVQADIGPTTSLEELMKKMVTHS